MLVPGAAVCQGASLIKVACQHCHEGLRFTMQGLLLDAGLGIIWMQSIVQALSPWYCLAEFGTFSIRISLRMQAQVMWKSVSMPERLAHGGTFW